MTDYAEIYNKQDGTVIKTLETTKVREAFKRLSDGGHGGKFGVRLVSEGDEPKQTQSEAEAGVRGGVEGLTLGMSDEIGGAISGAIEAHPLGGPLYRAVTDTPAPTGPRGEELGYLDRVKAATEFGYDETKKKRETAASESPAVYKASEFFGGALSPVGIGIGSGVSGRFKPGGTSLFEGAKAGAKQGAATGAGVGGMYGLGKGEGVEGRLESGAIGAGLGAAVGAPVGALGGGIGAKLRQSKAAQEIDPQKAALERIKGKRAQLKERSDILGKQSKNAKGEIDLLKEQAKEAAEEAAKRRAVLESEIKTLKRQQKAASSPSKTQGKASQKKIEAKKARLELERKKIGKKIKGEIDPLVPDEAVPVQAQDIAGAPQDVAIVRRTADLAKKKQGLLRSAGKKHDAYRQAKANELDKQVGYIERGGEAEAKFGPMITQKEREIQRILAESSDNRTAQSIQNWMQHRQNLAGQQEALMRRSNELTPREIWARQKLEQLIAASGDTGAGTTSGGMFSGGINSPAAQEALYQGARATGLGHIGAKGMQVITRGRK